MAEHEAPRPPLANPDSPAWWKQTKRSTRQMQLWLKHSLHALPGSDAARHQRASSSSAAPGPPRVPTADRWQKRPRTDRATVGSVDEALSALSHYSCFVEEKDNGGGGLHPCFREPLPPEDLSFDWILDGHREWKDQQRRTRELLDELYPSSTSGTDPWVPPGPGDVSPATDPPTHATDDEDGLALWQWGSVGQQEYRFASFEDLPPPTPPPAPPQQDLPEGFGSFQEAEEAGVAPEDEEHDDRATTEEEEEAEPGAASPPSGPAADVDAPPSADETDTPNPHGGTDDPPPRGGPSSSAPPVSGSPEPRTPTAHNYSHPFSRRTNDDDDDDGSSSSHHSPAEESLPRRISIPSVVRLVTAPEDQENDRRRTNRTPQAAGESHHDDDGDAVDDGSVPKLVTTTPAAAVSAAPRPANEKKQQRRPPPLLPPTPLGLASPPSWARGDSGLFTTTSTASISSPEGRFLRRTSQQRLVDDGEAAGSDPPRQPDYPAAPDQDSLRGQASLGSLVAVLPEGFADDNRGEPDDDPRSLRSRELEDTAGVLQGLEWDWIPYWKLDHLLQQEGCDESFVPLWLEQITLRLSDLDAAHLKISKRLYRLLQPHEAELRVANLAALDLGKNLRLCGMYLERSRGSIELARHGEPGTSSTVAATDDDTEKPAGGGGGGVRGAQNLLGWWDTQESYGALAGLLEEVEALFSIERDLQQRIEHYDLRREDSLVECRSILESTRLLRERLQGPEMSRLECLDDLRERSSPTQSNALVLRLHEWLESTTVRCCHPSSSESSTVGFDAEVHERLVEAFVLAYGDSTSDETFAKAFCTSIHTALLLEAQRSFGMALLNPTDSEHEESEYDKELMALGASAYLDTAKMGIWTSSLVTIRFDFEILQNPLPAVYHKLCWLLTNVLHGQYALQEWHRDAAERRGDAAVSGESLMARIRDEISARRPSVWNECVRVLEECLEEYLQHASKKKLFESNAESEQQHDDSVWMEDLAGLADVLVLTDQFLSLRKEFLSDVGDNSINNGIMLREKLYEIQKKHLRSFHIEAMNTMGWMLYQEDWSLVRLFDSEDETSKDSKEDIVASTIRIFVQKLSYAKFASTFALRSNRTRFSSNESRRLLEQFDLYGNPFDLCGDSRACNDDQSDLHNDIPHPSTVTGQVAELLKTFVGNSAMNKVGLVPACILNGIVPWISRMLLIIDKLPPIAEDVCKVFSNISDLYVTTVFRICCGSADHENILLGCEGSPPAFTPESIAALTARGSSASIFGFGRKQASKSTTSSPVLGATIEAEICSALPCEMMDVAPVRELIRMGQESLEGIAKLHLVDEWVLDPPPGEIQDFAELVCCSSRILEKRQGAIWGCAFLSVALEIACTTAQCTFQAGMGPKYGLTMVAMDRYVTRLSSAVPKLIEFACRIACVRAIRARSILQNILGVGSGWEEAKLHEHPNAYVDSLCDLCALLWCSLFHAQRLPLGAIEALWTTVIECGFGAMLDGFSRVPFCSTEGRALMSMDLASFSSGTSGRSILERLEGHTPTPKPPSISTNRGMPYVDTCIKVFYFPPADALQWIEENFRQYRKNHLTVLIAGATVSSDELSSIPDRIAQVESLYESEDSRSLPAIVERL